MSVEALSLSTEQQPPLPSLENIPEPAANPAELLANHVEAVRTQGDVLDAQHRLFVRNAVKSGAVIGAGISFVAESSVESYTLNPTVNVGILALAGLVAYRKFVRAPHDRTEGKARFNTPAQRAVGERYELYHSGERARSPLHPSQGKKQVTLHWHAPIISAETPSRGDNLEHLTYIARMARQAGVDKIAVNDSQVQAILPEAGDPNDSLRQVIRRKQLRLGGKVLDVQLHTKTPDEWLELANENRAREGYPLDTLLAKIQKHQYDHPLAVVSREYREPAQRRTRLLHAARIGVERQLDDIQPGRSADGHRERHYVRGILDANGNVHQFNNGKYGTTTTLERALGKTDEALVAAVENEDTDPQGAVRALEVLAYKKLKEKQVHIKDGDENPTSDKPASQSQSRQIQFYNKKHEKALPKEERIRSRLRRVTRTIGFIATAVAMGAGTYIGTDKIGHAYMADYQAAYDKILEDRGKDASLDYLDPAIDARLKGKWGVYQAVSNFMWEATDTIDYGPFAWRRFDYTPPKNPLNTKQANSARNQTNMGNVLQDENRVDWNVQENNLSAAGYWSTNVYESGTVLQSYNEDGTDIVWEHQDGSAAKHEFLRLPLTPPEGTNTYVGVSRNLAQGDFEYNTYTKTYTLNIPVLDGTKPVSAALNGKPIDIVRRPDGTYYMATLSKEPINDDVGGYLTYAVAKAADAVVVHPLEKVAFGNYSTETSTEAIDTAWQKIIPELPVADGSTHIDKQRTTMIANYIRSHWNYATAPWGDGAFAGVHTLPQQIARMNKIAKANCNIAGSNISVENPSFAPATGYMNSGDTTKLSAHESHLWTVDQTGFRVDATPSGGMSEADKQFFAEDYDKKPPEPNKEWLYGQLVLLAAATAVWRRRNIIKAGQTTKDGIVHVQEQLLTHTPEDRLRLATNLAEQVTYAAKLDVSAARQRAAQNATAAPALAKRLMRPNAGLHGKETSAALKNAARAVANSNDKRALRQAAHITKRARRVAVHAAKKQLRKQTATAQ